MIDERIRLLIAFDYLIWWYGMAAGSFGTRKHRLAQRCVRVPTLLLPTTLLFVSLHFAPGESD